MVYQVTDIQLLTVYQCIYYKIIVRSLLGCISDCDTTPMSIIYTTRPLWGLVVYQLLIVILSHLIYNPKWSYNWYSKGNFDVVSMAVASGWNSFSLRHHVTVTLRGYLMCYLISEQTLAMRFKWGLNVEWCMMYTYPLHVSPVQSGSIKVLVEKVNELSNICKNRPVCSWTILLSVSQCEGLCV